MIVVPRPGAEDENILSAEDFLDALSPRRAPWSEKPKAWIFRGQANAEWPLKPRAVRDMSEFERFGIRSPSKRRGYVPGQVLAWSARQGYILRMLERFKDGLDRSGLVVPTQSPEIDRGRVITSNAEPSPELYPLLALAQHHGLPTILLDWTRRALNAAYFAAVEAADVGRRGEATHLAVWALFRDGLTQPSEGPHFHDVPGGTNPNLNAQSGLFTTLFSETDISLEEHLVKQKKLIGVALPLRRMALPVSEAPKLLRLLSYEGVDGASMFPGADGVVRSMREEALWDRSE